MEDKIPLFCTQCGAILREHATFCQECGTPVGGTMADGTQTYRRDTGRGSNRSKLIIIAGLLVMLAAFSLYIGVFLLMDINGLMADFMSDPDSVQLMIQYGVTEEALRAVLEYMAYAFLAVGILALIDAVLTSVRKFWGIAFALTIIVPSTPLVIISEKR